MRRAHIHFTPSTQKTGALSGSSRRTERVAKPCTRHPPSAVEDSSSVIGQATSTHSTREPESLLGPFSLLGRRTTTSTVHHSLTDNRWSWLRTPAACYRSRHALARCFGLNRSAALRFTRSASYRVRSWWPPPSPFAGWIDSRALC